jgi:hypothetical protein
MLTTYLDSDAVGLVTVGAEGLVGADRAAGSGAAGAVGADGAVAFGRVGGQREFALPGPEAAASPPVDEVRNFF